MRASPDDGEVRPVTWCVSDRIFLTCCSLIESGFFQGMSKLGHVMLVDAYQESIWGFGCGDRISTLLRGHLSGRVHLLSAVLFQHRQCYKYFVSRALFVLSRDQKHVMHMALISFQSDASWCPLFHLAFISTPYSPISLDLVRIQQWLQRRGYVHA